jgi:selenocysteine-specific elongation factor
VGIDRTRDALKLLGGRNELIEISASAKWWHRNAISTASAICGEALTRLHDRHPERMGFPREEIAARFPAPPDPGFLAAALEGNASIAREGELYLLPARKPKAAELGSPLAKMISDVVRAAGASAPTRAELLEAVQAVSRDGRAVDKVVDGFVRAGEIVRVKELLFNGKALNGIQEKLVAFLSKHGAITVPEFKELCGLTRKHTIPLLEHFDGTKLTLRVGDKRQLRKGR